MNKMAEQHERACAGKTTVRKTVIVRIFSDGIILTFYCDDSGTSPDQRTAVAAGYLASVEQWQRFIPRWNSLLAEYGVSQLHRVDLESRKKQFRDWDLERQKEFLIKAHAIIRDHTYIAVGSGVIKADYEEIMPAWAKDLFGGVYGWCVNECLVRVAEWCEKLRNPYSENIDWVFERGTVGSGQVMTMLANFSKDPTWGPRLRLGTWSFLGKDTVPLQAADMIAYEVFKQIENQIIDKGQRPERRSILDLVRPNDESYLRYWDKARLLSWLRRAEAMYVNQWVSDSHG